MQMFHLKRTKRIFIDGGGCKIFKQNTFNESKHNKRPKIIGNRNHNETNHGMDMDT